MAATAALLPFTRSWKFTNIRHIIERMCSIYAQMRRCWFRQSMT